MNDYDMPGDAVLEILAPEPHAVPYALQEAIDAAPVCHLRIYYIQFHMMPDTYTVLPPDTAESRERWATRPRAPYAAMWQGLQMQPAGSTHPQGHAMRGRYVADIHHGVRIEWPRLPPELQILLRRSHLSEYCPEVAL